MGAVMSIVHGVHVPYWQGAPHSPPPLRKSAKLGHFLGHKSHTILSGSLHSCATPQRRVAPFCSIEAMLFVRRYKVYRGVRGLKVTILITKLHLVDN